MYVFAGAVYKAVVFAATYCESLMGKQEVVLKKI